MPLRCARPLAVGQWPAWVPAGVRVATAAVTAELGTRWARAGDCQLAVQAPGRRACLPFKLAVTARGSGACTGRLIDSQIFFLKLLEVWVTNALT